MQTEYEKLRAEESAVFSMYKNERKKIADNFYTNMQKQTHRTNLIASVSGAALLGFIFTALTVNTAANNLSYNTDTKKIETRIDRNVFAHYVPLIIAASLLCGIGLFGIKTAKDTKQNRIDSTKMANDILKKYFDKILLPLGAQNMPLRATTAAALIMNNMQEYDINTLRTLAADSMTKDDKGHYMLYDDCIHIASQIVIKYMTENPDLAYNVACIMRGENPKTYFVLNQPQKTR